jgi:hypothetical protein
VRMASGFTKVPRCKQRILLRRDSYSSRLGSVLSSALMDATKIVYVASDWVIRLGEVDRVFQIRVASAVSVDNCLDNARSAPIYGGNESVLKSPSRLGAGGCDAEPVCDGHPV